MTDYFDWYPLAFLAGREQEITIHPLGCGKTVYPVGKEYTVTVSEAERAQDSRFPGGGCAETETAVVGEDGCLRFTHSFPREGMYLLNLDDVPELRVYALNDDMAGRYPLRGDLHLHSNRSDGKEKPAVVVSNYRGHGYDFTVLSDHHRYYPSMEAREALHIGADDESDLTDMLVVRGEEVHLPGNPVHYVNFGGKFSINALVTPSNNQEKAGDDPKWRSADGECPEPITLEEFQQEIARRAAKVPREIESERVSFAIAQWIYERQCEAGGLGIFPHPYWLCKTMQLSEDYTRFFYEQHPFDVFEVLGGESYYQHNGFQTAFYYEMKAQGITYPVVGSTDSHSSFKTNRNALICSTIVFAPENKTQALVDSIKNYYSVAVDTISPEYRLVGDFRWVKYGSFLMENWYPIHDRLCSAEGVILRRYVDGDNTAEPVLKAMKGEVPAMFRKYFHM